MVNLIVLALIGLIAQLVDGALGMAYGLTSSSLLLMLGISPAVVSASVHLAEVVTTAASGVSHIRFGNVDKHLVKKLILPGAAGAFSGALFLGSIPGDAIKPYISLFLLALGIFIMYRFLFKPAEVGEGKNARPPGRGLIPLGFIAGFVDSTGGGGWGPVTTPVLLSRKNAETRKVVGSVDTSEFVVAVSATLGFLISLGWEQVHWPWVFALMAGGFVAAPIAAWLVKIMPSHLLGVLVGGMIILTNARTLLNTFAATASLAWLAYGFIIVSWLIAIFYAARSLNKIKKEVPCSSGFPAAAQSSRRG